MTDRETADDKEKLDCTKPVERTRTGTPRKSSTNYDSVFFEPEFVSSQMSHRIATMHYYVVQITFIGIFL